MTEYERNKIQTVVYAMTNEEKNLIFETLKQELEGDSMKRCPASKEPVTYLDCQECDDRQCENVDNSVDSVDNDMNLILWNLLAAHKGHHVEIVSYGDINNPCDICLECTDCNEVILDAELYTICAREDN